MGIRDSTELELGVIVRIPQLYPLSLYLLLALAVTSCTTGPWNRADDLVSHLRCGMSESDVRAEARRFNKVRITRSARSDRELVVIRGQTHIVLDLEAGRIQDYQINWISGFMKRLFVEVHIAGPVTCGWAVPYTRTIRICPQAFGAYCGSLGCTLIHEMTHQIGFPGEETPNAVEECLEC